MAKSCSGSSVWSLLLCLSGIRLWKEGKLTPTEASDVAWVMLQRMRKVPVWEVHRKHNSAFGTLHHTEALPQRKWLMLGVYIFTGLWCFRVGPGESQVRSVETGQSRLHQCTISEPLRATIFTLSRGEWIILKLTAANRDPTSAAWEDKCWQAKKSLFHSEVICSHILFTD